MRVLIVDDEAPARARLRQLLAGEPDVEIAGETGSGADAATLIATLKPDVVLLDIQMPGMTGLDLAASLAAPRPHIIFCTAFEQHAIDAFELDALDYLLKPVSRMRLGSALNRVRERTRGGGQEAILDRAARDTGQRGGPVRFLARNATHYLVIGEAGVLYFISEDGLTRLVAENGRFWMDPTLNELEARLDPRRFFRISRAALISLNAVNEVFPMPGGGGEVLMKSGQRLEVSRRRFRDLLELLQGGN
jgi:two-component system, LytTR family, response regulator